MIATQKHMKKYKQPYERQKFAHKQDDIVVKLRQRLVNWTKSQLAMEVKICIIHFQNIASFAFYQQSS